MDVVFVDTVVYLLVMVADYHIPHKTTEDNPVVFKDGLLYLLKEKILDTVGAEVNLDESHFLGLVRTGKDEEAIEGLRHEVARTG